ETLAILADDRPNLFPNELLLVLRETGGIQAIKALKKAVPHALFDDIPDFLVRSIQRKLVDGLVNDIPALKLPRRSGAKIVILPLRHVTASFVVVYSFSCDHTLY